MEQVFINCRLYNGVESPVGQMGIRVHNEYLNLLKSFKLVERFGDEKELQKFRLDEADFETRAAAGDGYKEEISESELPADSIRRMNERGENDQDNDPEAHSVHDSAVEE